MDVWAVANATLDDKLIAVCMPVIRSNFEDLSCVSRFCLLTDPKVLALILNDSRIRSNNVVTKNQLSNINDSNINEDFKSPKHHFLSLWLEGGDTVSSRDHVQDLLSELKFSTLDHDVLMELYAGVTALELPKMYRLVFC